jgi:hypothetical protein
LEYVIGNVQINWEELKLKGTHQLLGCNKDINLFSTNVYTAKKNTCMI